MTQIAELANKDFQTLMVNMLKTVEKKRDKRAQMVNLKNQICKKITDILQIKKKISELNKLEGRVEQQTKCS